MLYNTPKLYKGEMVMPPKPKFSKDDIVNAAFDIVRNSGADAMTAREVGKYLGTSSTPIFTAFNDMSELRAAVCDKARAVFDEYMAVAEDFSPAYKKRGMQWVKFAQENPMLFQLLFMSGNEADTDFNSAVEIMPFGKENDISIIIRDYNATPEQAEHLFSQMWVYTYGLCVLCARKVCNFTEDEIMRRLGEVFAGTVYVLKTGLGKTTTVNPAQKDSERGRNNTQNNPDLAKSELDGIFVDNR